MAIDIRPLEQTSNEVLLDRIRNDGSNEYQDRIPSATKAGIQQTLAALQTYRPQQNEFIDALVNRIGLTLIRNTSWTNPLKEFKRGMLTNGDTIEEIQVGLIKAKTYDPDRFEGEKEIFGRAPIEVQNNFHKLNRQDRYKITVNTPLLHRAFLQDGGIATFTGQLMSAPATSDEWDEFLIMCQLFSEYEANGGYFKVNVPDVSHPDSTADEAKDVLRKMRSMAGTLKFISSRYNAAHMPTHATPDELLIFCTPEFSAAIDVEALAGAFNIDKALMHGRIVEIPAERFGIEGAQALMTTKDFFVIADSLFETTNMFNPANLGYNYWLHHHQVISASRFVPAVLFTTQGGDEVVKVQTPVTSVSALTIFDREGNVPTSVERGEIYALHADAVTTPDGGVNNGVRWNVAGSTTTRTYITQTGVLHVGGDEGGETLQVTATATGRNEAGLMVDMAKNSKTLTVSGVAALEPWPNLDPVTGITVNGVAVEPAFTSSNTGPYTVAVPGGTTTPAKVKVSGPDSGDVKVTTNQANNVVTISAPSAPNDPVYTVNVTNSTP